MKLLLATVFWIVSSLLSEGAVSYFASDNYRERSDNPFISYLEGGVTYVEDFENVIVNQRPRTLLTTPYVTGWNGSPVVSRDFGVKEDYSVANPGGYIWRAGAYWSDRKLPNGIHFDFSPDEQGKLPDYVGAALLGNRSQTGAGGLYNYIFVYDKDGNEVTEGEWRFSIWDVPESPKDYFLNFYGIHVPGGISQILFRDMLQVDHLTYGYSAIPEPAVTGLAAAAAAALGLGLRRRRLS